jgi:hypothetical protein
MTSEIKKISGQYNIEPLGLMPGIFICHEASRIFTDLPLLEESPEALARKLFNKFVQQIPCAEKALFDLRKLGCISEAHLFLPLTSIFFLFLDELVAQYQNQLDEKDLKKGSNITNDLQEVKMLCARKINLAIDTGPEEIVKAVKKIEDKLREAQLLPPQFKQIIKLWSSILNIKYIGNVILASLYAKNNYKIQLVNHSEIPRYQVELSSEYYVTARTTPKEAYTGFLQEGACCLWLQKKDLEQSFDLILQLLSENAYWVLPKLIDNTSPDTDPQLALDLHTITCNRDRPEPLHTAVLDDQIAFCKLLISLKKVRLDDNLSVQQCLTLIASQQTIFNAPQGRMIEKLKNWGPGPVPLAGGVTVKITPQLLQELEKYHECFLIYHPFLSTPLTAMMEILLSCFQINSITEYYKNQPGAHVNTLPPIQISSLMPSLVALSDEDWAIPAPSASKNIPAKKSKKKKTGNPGTPPKKVVPVRDQPVETPIPKGPVLLPLSPLERLKLKFRSLKPSPILRQALWHLETLETLQGLLPSSKPKPISSLCLIVLVTNSAHKVLEQTYLWRLKKEGSLLERTHNLKVYHRDLFPNTAQLPHIVEKLFLGNTWYRFFYPEYQKWNSLTMNLATIPPVLSLLIKVAEGKSLSSQELREFVAGTLEEVRIHTESLLAKEAPSPTEGVAPETLSLVEAPKKVSFKSFDKISADLMAALQKYQPHHPAALHIKQALSSLRTLKFSQEQILQAKEIPAFSLWVTCCLQQLQESTEHVLLAILRLKTEASCTDHEIKVLAEKVGLEIPDSLAAMFYELSYKTRYPVEIAIDSLPAQIIDDLEAIKQHPEILKGFQLQELPNILWKTPSGDISLGSTLQKLNTCMQACEEFLRFKASPLLLSL